MSFPYFLDPYEADVFISGVIEGLQPFRSTFMQDRFGTPQYTEKTRVNLDLEYNIKNVMGQFVAPRSDVDPIVIPDFGTQELYFSYSKEGLQSDDFETLNTRQLGQQPGNIDVMANALMRLQKKAVLAEQRFENLFELCATNIILYGGYQAAGERHPTVRYDFGRKVITTYKDYMNTKLTPSVNFTTTAVTAPWDSSLTVLPVLATNGGLSFTAGDKAWTVANIDAKKATPIKDVTKMLETAKVRAGTDVILMSDDAYEAFSYDLSKNYTSATSEIVKVIMAAKLEVLPRPQNYKGFTFRRLWVYDVDTQSTVAIYTNNAIYADRITGVETPYIGSGWVLALPPASNGLKIYGRIMHPRAQYRAMPRWINYWENKKTGEEEWEYHTNFLMAHTDINSIVAFKVL